MTPTPPAEGAVQLVKVLVEGKSCHGGTMEWSLPNGKPGEWMEVAPPLKMCKRGIHLTKEPVKWLKAGCRWYEAEAGEILAWNEDKALVSRARLVRELPRPDWWLRVESFLEEIKTVPWCKPDGKPNPEWKVFPSRGAAGDAAGAAARAAAGDAAWVAAWDAAGAAAGDAAGDAAGAAAGDAALKSGSLIAEDRIETKHLAHINARWEVWTKGFCLLCDVQGVLYVYTV